MSAADQLVGLDLADGWRVTRHLSRNPNGTGGTFSQSYEARRGNQQAFLKAFDFWQAFEPGVETLEAIRVLTAAYAHERSILGECADRRMSNVSLAIGHGQVHVPTLPLIEGTVFYLLFEMAKGDVRCQIDTTKRLDSTWCLQALRAVALGLWQVHRALIAHQDTKPSNVLVYDQDFRVADFGRASSRNASAQHDNFDIAGDRSYAPPEQLYGHLHADFTPRRIGCDLYMLGNLASFLFTGVNITAQLISHLAPEHQPRNWQGTYREVLPYLQASFTQTLEELKAQLAPADADIVVQLVGELCNPGLDLRGHPRGIGRPNQYSLERYVSQLDLLAKRASIARRSSAGTKQ